MIWWLLIEIDSEIETSISYNNIKWAKWREREWASARAFAKRVQIIILQSFSHMWQGGAFWLIKEPHQVLISNQKSQIWRATYSRTGSVPASFSMSAWFSPVFIAINGEIFYHKIYHRPSNAHNAQEMPLCCCSFWNEFAIIRKIDSIE